jgi:hypothetical protein
VTTASVTLTPEVFISGCVLDAGGQPVYAVVEAHRISAGTGMQLGVGCSRRATAPPRITHPDTGEFKLQGLTAGRYELRLRSVNGGRASDPDAAPLVVSTTYGPVRHVVMTWFPDPNAAGSQTPRFGRSWMDP